jgi:hypothetical protein
VRITDPRLTDISLLCLAAKRAQARREARDASDWERTTGLASLLEASRHLPTVEPWDLPELDHRGGLGRLLARGARVAEFSPRLWRALMALDPRLTDSTLLYLAAKRAQAPRQTPQRVERLRVVYEDGLGIEPDLAGPTYRYTETSDGWILTEEAPHVAW